MLIEQITSDRIGKAQVAKINPKKQPNKENMIECSTITSLFWSFNNPTRKVFIRLILRLITLRPTKYAGASELFAVLFAVTASKSLLSYCRLARMVMSQARQSIKALSAPLALTASA
jgi:hypothetical protein